MQSQDLTEITNGLRQVLNLTKVQQLNSQNAIIVRDTADKLAIARKLLKDIDKAKPEVVIQVEVLSASTDRLRDLGVLPGQSASVQFTPPGTTSTSSTSSGSSTGTSTPSSIPLKGFHFGGFGLFSNTAWSDRELRFDRHQYQDYSEPGNSLD